MNMPAIYAIGFLISAFVLCLVAFNAFASAFSDDDKQ